MTNVKNVLTRAVVELYKYISSRGIIHVNRLLDRYRFMESLLIFHMQHYYGERLRFADQRRASVI